MSRSCAGAGEIVLFDRSWYNRAGVERVTGFCTDEEYWEFMRTCPELERMLVRDGIHLRKHWFRSATRSRNGASSSARPCGSPAWPPSCGRDRADPLVPVGLSSEGELTPCARAGRREHTEDQVDQPLHRRA
jgi:hypothetical protein